MSTETKETMRRILVGVGNAGVAVLDRIAIEHPGMKGLLVINNDEDSLAASIVKRRIAFPLGDLGEAFLAIEEEFGLAISGAVSVTFCGGLGGECSSFLLPSLVARTKAAGVTTLACVGMPFGFEGRQRRDLATAALEKLHELCDGVAIIDNDRLSGGAPSTAAIREAFQIADQTLQNALMALQGMLSSSGPVKITRADLVSVLGISGAMTHFGYGQAEGGNRLHEALEMALKSPLLAHSEKGTKGGALKEVSTLLLLLQGAQDLSFAEVQRTVSELESLAGEECRIKVGVHADRSPGAPLEIFILASSGVERPALKHSEPAVSRPLVREAVAPRPVLQPIVPPLSPEPMPVAEKPNKAAEPPSSSRPSKAVKNSANPVKQTQGVLDLDTYQRGRFDKSEPTIVAGEDLDTPTFMRKGIKLGSPSRR